MKILSDVEDLVTEATKAKADCHVGEEAYVVSISIARSKTFIKTLGRLWI